MALVQSWALLTHSSSPLPPGSLFPSPAGVTATSAAAAFPGQQVPIQATCAQGLCPVHGTFGVCRIPGTRWACEPQCQARAVCGGRRSKAGGGQPGSLLLPQ